MKKFFSMAITCLMACTLLAQAPQKFSYQAAAVDASGAELDNQEICLRASILSGAISGTEEWVEIHNNISTDDFGLFSIEIGDGMPIAGAQANFGEIPWGDNIYYLKMEMSLNNLCTDFVLVGVNELLSVPYALYSEEAGHAITADEANHAVYSDTSLFSSNALSATYSDTSIYSSNAGTAYYSDTALVALTALNVLNDDDADPQNEIQQLSYTGDTVFLTGSTQFIPLFEMDPDHDPENEIQELQLDGSLLSLTLGSGSAIDLNSTDGDTDASNELQELQLNGTTISLTGGVNSFDLQNIDPDPDPTNELQELTYDTLSNSIGITNGANTIQLSNLSGFNASGATLNYPQGVDAPGIGFMFIPDEYTVPNDSVFYITASEDEMRLPAFGSNFGRHLTGPNLPILQPGIEIDNCRCIGFLKPYDPFFKPVTIVLQPNQANFYQVPFEKNLVIKSGLDQTTPLTLDGFTISPFGSVLRGFVIPDGIQIKNIGNDEVILTGYLLDK